MFNYLKQKNKSGFTLVEMLIALSIISMSIVALMTVLGSGISNTTYSKNKMEATFLAEEGVEYVKNIRDTFVIYDDPSNPSVGWSAFKNRMILGATNPCNDVDVGCNFRTDLPLNISNLNSQSYQNIFGSCANVSDCSLFYNDSTGSYLYPVSGGNGGTDSGFVRKIFFTELSSDEIKITSTVTWATGSVTFSDDFLNWTPGLTSTINVGGGEINVPTGATKCALAEDGYCLTNFTDGTVYYGDPSSKFFADVFTLVTKTQKGVPCNVTAFDLAHGIVIQNAQCYFEASKQAPVSGYVALPYGATLCADKVGNACEYKDPGTIYYGSNDYTQFISAPTTNRGSDPCTFAFFNNHNLNQENGKAQCYYLPNISPITMTWDPTFCSTQNQMCGYDFTNMPDGGVVLYGSADYSNTSGSYASRAVNGNESGQVNCDAGEFGVKPVNGTARCYVEPNATGCYSVSSSDYQTLHNGSADYCVN
ncbi:MAG: type II secretion system protein [bacterium]